MSATLNSDPVAVDAAIAFAGEAALSVDDDPEFRSLVAGLLEKKGVSVHEAASVVEALEVLEAHDVDVIVCDYTMPEAPGTVLLAEAVRRGYEGRFVLTSASLPPEAAAEARGQGARALSKWDLLESL